MDGSTNLHACGVSGTKCQPSFVVNDMIRKLLSMRLDEIESEQVCFREMKILNDVSVEVVAVGVGAGSGT